MNLIEVGIGKFETSSDVNSVIKTYALGSCVAVIIYDSESRIGGMIHIALPDSDINIKKSERDPAYFANTGLPLLFNKMNLLGAKRKSSTIKMVGGASVIKNCESFDIGKRNVLAVRKILWNKKLGLIKEDVGGNFSRTVSLNIADGTVTISNSGNNREI
ncbi:MAG: chemotaxis protein CheD [Spirochaetaceae bacterium]|nr:chemotaxis protein CheD [Spirochaetaceae bacterium]